MAIELLLAEYFYLLKHIKKISNYLVYIIGQYDYGSSCDKVGIHGAEQTVTGRIRRRQ